MGRFGSRSRPRFPPRQSVRDWARVVSATLITVPAASKVVLATFVDSSGEDRTVRRSIGMLWVQSDQVSVVEEQTGALGALVVTDLAVAAGAGSIPGPVTDRNDDVWATWMPFLQASELPADTDTRRAGYHYHFDSKGQRKLPGGTQYVFMVENSSATEGLQVMFAASVLVTH